MTSQASDAATGAAEESVQPQQETAGKGTPSLQDLLMQVAREEGAIDVPKAEGPSTEQPTEAEDQQPEETSPELELPLEEGAEEKTGEEEEPVAAKPGSEWPTSAKTRVAEETDKRKRANDRADRAEAEVSKLQARVTELEQAFASRNGPTPTRENSMIDIQDVAALDQIERIYDDLVEVDVTQVDEHGNVPIIVSRKPDGTPVWQPLPAQTVELLQKRAERALRKDVPQRRKYLESRGVEDAKAMALYPELGDKDAEFSQIAAYLANKVITGNAQSDPELLQWIGHAVYGFRKRMEELKANGGVTTGETSAQRITQSAKTKLAPTAPRARGTLPASRSGRMEVAQAEAKFMKTRSVQDAEELVGAMLRNRGQRRMQPQAE